MFYVGIDIGSTASKVVVRGEKELHFVLPTGWSSKETTLTIREKLLNPTAADDLIDEVEAAITNRLPDCECFEPYLSSKYREHPYYRIYVKNYIVFYVVIKDGNRKIMEVRRILYKGQDRDDIV